MAQESASASSTWRTLSEESASTVEKSGGAIVAIHGRRRIPSSGVHWRRGVIVTADHTLQRDEEISITKAGGETVVAGVAGRDPSTDLAILKVSEANLSLAEKGDIASVRPGHLVSAVGRTGEGGMRASLAMIGVVGPAWRTWSGGSMDRTVRLDRNLHPNFSGGAVIDHEGRVLGIATSAFSRFAALVIPASTIERVAAELEKKGHVGRAYIGAGMQAVRFPQSARESLKLKSETGILVVSVEPDGPAEKAGTMLGDALVAFDANVLHNVRDVQIFLAGTAAGNNVKVTLVRGGALKELTLTLGERPSAG